MYCIIYTYIFYYIHIWLVRGHSHLQDYQRGQVCKLLQIYMYIYIYTHTSLIQRHSDLQNYQTLLRIETRPVTPFYCLPVSFIFRWFLHHFLWLLSHFPALSLYFSSIFTASSRFVPSIRSGFLHFPGDWSLSCLPAVSLYFPIHPLRGFSVCLVQRFFHYMVPTIFTSFLHGFLHHFLWFPAFSMYFSKSFTRLLHFPIVFAPFPLVVITFSCAFTLFFQHFYCIVIVCS